jgi:hypothetical protein
MPTRLVLRETTPSRVKETIPDESEYVVRQRADAFTTPPRSNLQRSGPSSRSTSQRKVVGFRSSILRDLSHNNVDDNDDDDDFLGPTQDEAAAKRRLQLHLSNEDIRASPRLLGYLFAAIGE